MPIEIYAHRGASMYAPENTMSAFQLAYEQGADGIEVDVHLTKDHVPVIIHDEQLERTTNGKGFIKDYTYKELQQFDAGSWFSDQFTDETIISLETFLQWIAAKDLLLNIELKNHKVHYEDMESIVYHLLKKYKLLSRTVISSFNPRSIQKLNDFPNIKSALLRSRWRWNLPAFAQRLGADALHIPYRLLSRTLVNQAKRLNLPVRVYTINSQRRMIRCVRYKCEGIFTDVPDLCIYYRKRMIFK